MNEQRLEELLMMACERNITDDISIAQLAMAWAALKQRRIAIS